MTRPVSVLPATLDTQERDLASCVSVSRLVSVLTVSFEPQTRVVTVPVPASRSIETTVWVYAL